MSGTSKTDRDFLFTFIRYYKLLPALWNTKCQDYRDNIVRKKCYMLLLKKYKEHYPKATLTDLKKKVNSLRSNFRRYYRKQKSDQPPSLYWFEEMKFIIENEEAEIENEIDVEASYAELKPEDLEICLTETETFDEHEIEEEHLEDLDHLDIPDNDMKYESWQNDQDSLCSPVRLTKISQKQVPTLIYKSEPQQTISIHESSTDEEYENWGKVMAAELRKLNPKQQIFAKKAIRDVLFEGQLGLLKRGSVQINMPDGSEI